MHGWLTHASLFSPIIQLSLTRSPPRILIVLQVGKKGRKEEKRQEELGRTDQRKGVISADLRTGRNYEPDDQVCIRSVDDGN